MTMVVEDVGADHREWTSRCLKSYSWRAQVFLGVCLKCETRTNVLSMVCKNVNTQCPRVALHTFKTSEKVCEAPKLAPIYRVNHEVSDLLCGMVCALGIPIAQPRVKYMLQ
jgi:hypothetical protein